MQRPFEQLAPSNYRDRRARLARLREVVAEILGPHWEVHVKPGRRRIHLVCGESKPPTPDLELLAAAILWESRKNGDSFRKLQYSRAHSQWKCPWGTLMQVRKALSAPRVTEVHFQTDEDNDIFGAACNLWQKLQVFVPFVNRPFEYEIHGTVNFTQFCCVLLVTWCYRVLLSCYLRPK